MPHATEILDRLSTIANQASGIAVAWYVVIATAFGGEGTLAAGPAHCSSSHGRRLDMRIRLIYAILATSALCGASTAGAASKVTVPA